MRLLNTITLELEEFMDDSIPKYAILSHRWQKDEVSFFDMQNGKASSRAGFKNLKDCCNMACQHKYGYVWIDACCIDKSSSAELSEAINSMYRWYENADVCYTYLFDVDRSFDLQSPVFKISDLASSQSYLRGWTLQELLAPRRVEFYDVKWKYCGTRDELRTQISELTGIEEGALSSTRDAKYLQRYSIAKRMSWASKRTTTRIEDMAYCLLGIFQVNMPLLYGEGEKAFIRLQEEIMKHSDDQSLFAWSSLSPNQRGLLATSAALFRQSSGVSRSYTSGKRAPYGVTNMGLSINFFMVPWTLEIYLAALDCEDRNQGGGRLGVFLQLLDEVDQYARVPVDGVDIQHISPSDDELKGEAKKIYVRQDVWHDPQVKQMYGFWIKELPQRSQDSHISDVVCSNKWSNEDKIFELPTADIGIAGAILFGRKRRQSTLRLGFDKNFNLSCQAVGPLFRHLSFVVLIRRLAKVDVRCNSNNCLPERYDWE